MKYYSEEEKLVLDEFLQNGGSLIISFRRDGSMRDYSPAFASQVFRLVRRGVIERVASGDFRWVKFQLKDGVGS